MRSHRTAAGIAIAAGAAVAVTPGEHGSAQGAAMTVWRVLGHECGHGGFSQNRAVSDAVLRCTVRPGFVDEALLQHQPFIQHTPT